MPWGESAMSARMRFITRLEDGERMTDLCKEDGISRKTGYKIKRRFDEAGVVGLRDQARRPRSHPRTTPKETRKLVLGARKAHPTWGAPKLAAWLRRKNPGVRVPSRTTIGKILKEAGLTRGRKQRRRSTPSSGTLCTPTRPNELWAADFKGQFRLGNGRYCYPLTITDSYSRYVLACIALEGTGFEGAEQGFLETFSAYGLPEGIRTDNGSPFSSVGLAGLSKLSAGWLRLGIAHERIQPGHPEQNGRHERFHLTLKQETTRPAAENELQQQECFDRFLETFNMERPHEALGQRPPAEVYTSSSRALPKKLPNPDYSCFDTSLCVASDGRIWLPGRPSRRAYVSAALAGYRVGVREVELGKWLIAFMNLELGVFDTLTGQLAPITTGVVGE